MFGPAYANKIFARIAFVAAAMTPMATMADPTLNVPNTSNIPPAGPPVQIESCTTGNEGGVIVAQTDGRFKVVFTNEGAVTADLVRFQIDLGSERLFIRDVGTYSPGITVTHVFRRRGGNVVSSPLFAPAPFTCNVVAVHFTDGTQWAPPTAESIAAQAKASQPQILGDGYLGVRFTEGQTEPIVRFAIPGGPAALGGLTQGDLIQQINGQNVDSVNDVSMLVSATPIGTSLGITVSRGGQPLTLHVVVGHRPAATVTPQ